MAIDAKDVDKLQTALNDASGKASALWITFITFELYLAIAFGSVTHRDLFLENPIKLPVLNVDLPLVGFFVVAATVLVIFHFYIFLQLLALAQKAREYNAILKKYAPNDVNSQLLRHGLDSFLILQFLAGPTEQRTGYTGVWLRLIAWITLVGVPIVILLQAQVTFLPYHLQRVQWLLRICTLFDLTVIWFFWNPVRSEDQPISKWVPTVAWWMVGGIATAGVVAFSVLLATFPSEFLNDYFSTLPFREGLFAGNVDEVTGRPHSLFSNRLVLIDQNFVEADKLDKMEVSRYFRGRDLREAVLNRADLRKADFTGAMLNKAQFESAKLQGAQFGCADTGKGEFKETDERWPDDGCAWLRGADFWKAELQDANFEWARLQGASFASARLEGAKFVLTRLQGASFAFARLQGANFWKAALQGAVLNGAELEGASLLSAKLEGADLHYAQLQGASLIKAQLQGAILSEAKLQGASLETAFLWLVRGTPEIYLTDLNRFDNDTTPWQEAHSTFDKWRDEFLKWIPTYNWNVYLKRFDPEWDRNKLIPAAFWKAAMSASLQGEQREVTLAEFLANLACSRRSSPYVARGLLRNVAGGLLRTGHTLNTVFADRLRKGKSDQAACPGVTGFADEDWAMLDDLLVGAPKPEASERTK
jgi:uncharacterized protein YjbI with pentapeptide repeats